jgi:hypothetical protein
MIEQFSVRVKAKTPPENPLRAKFSQGAEFRAAKSDLAD